MSLTSRRVSAAGLVLALLLAVTGLAAPAAAAPALPPEVPSTPGTHFASAPPNPSYTYPSLRFWRTEMPWDSPDLSTAKLAPIKTGRTAYRGQVGSKNHLLSRWKMFARKAGIPRWETLTDEQKRAYWEEYLDDYVTVLDNKARGKAFEEHFAKLVGLLRKGYLLDEMLRKHFGGVTGNKRGDAFQAGSGGVLFELKSGSSPIDRTQARCYAEFAARNGKALVYVFGSEPDPNDLAFLDKLNREMAAISGHTANVYVRSWPSTAVPVRHPNAPPPPPGGSGASGGGSTPTPSGPAGSLAAKGQYDAGGASDDTIAGSPSSAGTAAALADLDQTLAEDLGYDTPRTRTCRCSGPAGSTSPPWSCGTCRTPTAAGTVPVCSTRTR